MKNRKPNFNKTENILVYKRHSWEKWISRKRTPGKTGKPKKVLVFKPIKIGKTNNDGKTGKIGKIGNSGKNGKMGKLEKLGKPEKKLKNITGTR